MVEPGSEDRRRVVLIGIVGWYLIALCGFGLTPLYPEIAVDLRIGPAVLGLVLAVSSVVSAAFQVPAGALADKLGVRTLLAAGVLLASSATLVRGFAPDAFVFALGQVGIGLAIPIFQAGSITGVANAYPSQGRATAIGYLFSAFQLGSVSSVVVFGLLGARLGWRTTTLMLTPLPLVVLPLIATVALAGPIASTTTFANRLLVSIRFVFHGRPLLLAGVAALASLASTANVFLLPFVMRARGIGVAETSVLLVSQVVGAILGAPLLGFFADRFGVRPPLVGGLAVSALGIGALALSGSQPLAVAAAFLVLGLAVGGVPALTQSQVIDEAGRLGVGSGAALGGMRLAQSVGPAVGPTLAGVLLAQSGGGIAQLATVAALGAAAALAAATQPPPLLQARSVLATD